MNLEAILVDDEQDARDVLRHYLSKYCEDITLVGEAKNIIEAEELIHSKNPKLVFLDIEMPFGSGLDLLEKFTQPTFYTIFVTAFDQYAIQALNKSASYYLLKPVSIDELLEAIDKVKATIQEADKPEYEILFHNMNHPNQHKLVLPTLDGFEVIDQSEICYCKADDNFTLFYMNDGTEKLISKTLKHFEQLLPESTFVRVHRSFLVNMEYVAQYNKGKGGFLTLKNGTQIEVSATKKKSFLDWFRG